MTDTETTPAPQPQQDSPPEEEKPQPGSAAVPDLTLRGIRVFDALMKEGVRGAGQAGPDAAWPPASEMPRYVNGRAFDKALGAIRAAAGKSLAETDRRHRAARVHAGLSPDPEPELVPLPPRQAEAWGGFETAHAGAGDLSADPARPSRIRALARLLRPARRRAADPLPAPVREDEPAPAEITAADGGPRIPLYVQQTPYMDEMPYSEVPYADDPYTRQGRPRGRA